MSTRLFVVIADGDVFNKIVIPSEVEISARYYAGLSSNPKFINCTGLGVQVTDVWDGTNFYHLTDVEKSNPLVTVNVEELEQKVQYALVSDLDVFGKMTLSADDPTFEMIKAGMESSPVCVESTSTPSVDVGWSWDGTEFHPPVSL
jgi:hypothetical protein